MAEPSEAATVASEPVDKPARCVNCGYELVPVNWSTGPGWKHEVNGIGDSRCPARYALHPSEVRQ